MIGDSIKIDRTFQGGNMKVFSNNRIFGYVCCVIFFITMSAGTVLGEETVIIVNKSVTDSTLTRDDVEKIFLGRKTRWDDDQSIHFVILEKVGVHGDFLKTYIGKTESQYSMFWKKMVFTGKGSMPKSFKTVEEIMEYVAATPGSISFIPAASLNDTIKRITVN